MRLEEIVRIISIIIGTFLFNYLFWDNNLGINLLIFNLFIMCGAYLNYCKRRNVTINILALSCVVLSLDVIYHNSSMATFTCLLSLVLFVGFTHSEKLKSIPFAIAEAFVNYFRWPKQIFSFFMKNGKKGKPRVFKKYIRILRLTIIPFAISAVFYFIFKLANPIFEDYANSIEDNTYRLFENLLFDLSFSHFVFFIWGFTLLFWIFFNRRKSKVLKFENNYSDVIVRKESRTKNKLNHVLALVNENNTGSILLLFVNLLLVVVNFIDIKWLWFNFEYSNDRHISQFVHEGTHLLILSILLSMFILLFLFRKNQNFYPRSSKLKLLAYVWIFQNIILVISVGMRNYHYIHDYGLAYKRIGVFFFLVATLGGIVSMFYKIRHTRSGYFLMRINSWIVYGCFIGMSFFNWDNIILNHNLNHYKPENMHVSFLVELSDKTLPTLYENKEKLQKMGWSTVNARGWRQTIELDYRIIKFKEQYESRSWQSWNYCDYLTYQYFKEIEFNEHDSEEN